MGFDFEILENQKKNPLRFQSFLKYIRDIKDWFRFRCFERYHILVLGKPGWRDVDELMFQACFRLLGRFVEEELGTIPVDYPYDHYCGYRLHSYGGGDEKAIDLWLWYRHQLPKLYHDSNQNYQSFLEKNGHHYIENMKDHKFKELIEMRGHLWT